MLLNLGKPVVENIVLKNGNIISDTEYLVKR